MKLKSLIKRIVPTAIAISLAFSLPALANTATNPLDRLSLIDKINELDTCAKYFADYKNFVNAPAQSEPPKAKQSKENN